MSWHSTYETFPPAVQNALPVQGTMAGEHYRIGKALRVCGTELTCEGTDIRTDTPVLLHGFLPLRWCSYGEDGWQPYQQEGAEYSAVCERILARLEQLRTLQEESALLPILDIVKENGTIWAVTEYTAAKTLAEELALRLFTPQEAIDLLAPVMDTLAGLHEISVYHGNLSAYGILLDGENALLTGWCSALDAESSANADVKAISTLMYRMVTGEQIYRQETAAALPSGIRKALRMGMEQPDMTMDKLWKMLHADRPSRRTKRIQRKAGSSGLGNLFSPAFTIIFCILCCAVPAAFGVASIIGSRLQDAAYELAEDEIRVPELLYLSQEEAVQTAEALGLHVIIASREDNPVVESNCIVTQKPNAGAILKAGDTIQLVISDGWSNYMPDVTNMLREDAVALLEELGFVVKCQEIFSAGDAPDTVISQSIKAETNLQRDSIVRLQVSLGRSDVDTSKFEMVGNYVGMTFTEAKAMLSELHLYAFQSEAVYDPEVPKGVVISQEVAEGREVPQGTIISMVVSLGVETVRVPDVTMMNVNAAKSLLEGMRLKPVLMYEANSKYATDCIISQKIAAGQLVPVNSEIFLAVSTGTQNTIVSTGGWSGNPLPTVDSTETTASETETSEATGTQTDVTEITASEEETDMTTERTETTQPETTRAPETTVSTTAAPEPTETDPPVTDPPVTDPPATDPPATEPPATEPPATEAPETDPPAEE